MACLYDFHAYLRRDLSEIMDDRSGLKVVKESVMAQMNSRESG
jgi:hypothetical protein